MCFVADVNSVPCNAGLLVSQLISTNRHSKLLAEDPDTPIFSLTQCPAAEQTTESLQVYFPCTTDAQQLEQLSAQDIVSAPTLESLCT